MGLDWVVLFEGIESLKILWNFLVWFFMMDGEIGRDELQKFISYFCENGVYGIVVVVIFFGYRYCYLLFFYCNVLVGIFVYGIVFYVIFLFYDIQIGIVLVFEVKGYFLRVIFNEWWVI